MKLTSPAFHEGGIIPSIYTCEGKNFNPSFRFEQVPPSAKSLVFICDDPDVPKSVRADQMFDHWVIYNIPPQERQIGERAKPPGTEGKNTSGKIGYYGPCPPDREHRYFFKLYALDQWLDLPPGATKKEVEHAMEGHVIAQCQLIGRYEKGKGY